MVHIDTLRTIVSEAFPKSPSPDVYRTLNEGNANDDCHFITIHKASGERIGVKASVRETSGAYGEELAYKVSALLGLGVVTPAKVVGTHVIFDWNNDTGVAVIKWVNRAINLGDVTINDLDTSNGDFAISLGYTSFLCWLLAISDRHDANAVVSDNRIYCIDNEDVLDDYRPMDGSFAFLWDGMKFLDNEGKLLAGMAFAEAMWRFNQVRDQVTNLIFSYSYFLKADLAHWDRQEKITKLFENKVNFFMK